MDTGPQFLLHSLDRPQPQQPDGVGGAAHARADFLEAEPFLVAQLDDAPVVGGKTLQSLVQQLDFLVRDRNRAGRLGVGTQRLLRLPAVWEGPEGLFTADPALAGLPVPPAVLGDVVAQQTTEPRS